MLTENALTMKAFCERNKKFAHLDRPFELHRIFIVFDFRFIGERQVEIDRRWICVV